MPFPIEDDDLESEGLGDLGPAVGIGRIVLALLAAWIVVLCLLAWWII